MKLAPPVLISPKRQGAQRYALLPLRPALLDEYCKHADEDKRGGDGEALEIRGLAALVLGDERDGGVEARETREAAAITFLVTASGATFAGISGAFWGLVAGASMMALAKLMKRNNVI